MNFKELALIALALSIPAHAETSIPDPATERKTGIIDTASFTCKPVGFGMVFLKVENLGLGDFQHSGTVEVRTQESSGPETTKGDCEFIRSQFKSDLPPGEPKKQIQYSSTRQIVDRVSGKTARLSCERAEQEIISFQVGPYILSHSASRSLREIDCPLGLDPNRIYRIDQVYLIEHADGVPTQPGLMPPIQNTSMQGAFLASSIAADPASKVSCLPTDRASDEFTCFAHYSYSNLVESEGEGIDVEGAENLIEIEAKKRCAPRNTNRVSHYRIESNFSNHYFHRGTVSAEFLCK